MSNAAQLHALICVALIAGVQAAEEATLPSSIKICHHEEPNYSECLRSSLQDSWSIIVNGIPELGLPVLDPLVLNEVKEEEHDIFSPFGAAQIRSVARDVKILGLANSTFLSVRPTRTANRMSIDLEATVPHVFMDGRYKVQGRVGSMKIGGKGYFNVTSDGSRAAYRVDGRIENDRWVIEHVRTNPDAVQIDKLKIHFDDLFNGNEELNKAALTFVNEFWPMLYRTMHPIMERQWDARMTDLLNKMIFSKLSFAKTFP